MTFLPDMFAIWLIFECTKATMARKSQNLLDRTYWVTIEVYICTDGEPLPPRIQKIRKLDDFNSMYVTKFEFT